MLLPLYHALPWHQSPREPFQVLIHDTEYPDDTISGAASLRERAVDDVLVTENINVP
ncbi:MAG: hypothetical protein Q6370_014225 [Candidatus Sigynarchaeota archaeon]